MWERILEDEHFPLERYNLPTDPGDVMAKLAGPQEILSQFGSVVGALCEQEDKTTLHKRSNIAQVRPGTSGKLLL
jgi:hypothetical protein